MQIKDFLLALALCTAATTGSVDAKPRVSLAEAKKIALARVPGKVVHEKVKNKKHEHVVYNIKIAPVDKAKAGFLEKVQVDGDTGKILKIKQVKAKKSADGDEDE
jgi:uncharacterized membrane protein YkoI